MFKLTYLFVLPEGYKHWSRKTMLKWILRGYRYRFYSALMIFFAKKINLWDPNRSDRLRLFPVDTVEVRTRGYLSDIFFKPVNDYLYQIDFEIERNVELLEWVREDYRLSKEYAKADEVRAAAGRLARLRRYYPHEPQDSLFERARTYK